MGVMAVVTVTSAEVGATSAELSGDDAGPLEGVNGSEDGTGAGSTPLEGVTGSELGTSEPGVETPTDEGVMAVGMGDGSVAILVGVTSSEAAVVPGVRVMLLRGGVSRAGVDGAMDVKIGVSEGLMVEMKPSSGITAMDVGTATVDEGVLPAPPSEPGIRDSGISMVVPVRVSKMGRGVASGAVPGVVLALEACK